SAARTQPARDLLAALFRVSTYAGDERQSAGAALDQARAAFKGVWYLDGGWQSLVTGLLDVAKREGVEVVTGAPVVAVEHGAAVRGVRLGDGSFVACDEVVIAAGPEVARSLVSGEAAERIGAWAEAAIPVEAACLDLVVTKRAERPTFALGLDRPFYFSVHSRTAKLGPEDREVIHVAKYLGAQAADAKRDEAELEAFLDGVEPGWRAHVIERRFLPRMTVTHALVSAAMGGLAGRPGPDLAGVAGLVLAGDWIGPTAMLADAALASGRAAARRLVESRAPSAVAC
ncbi:MAG: FAD-dependent oxidoreductase, partial [Planctomycetota bacterium]